MRTALETFFVAFSMFSAVPVPQVEWNPRNMRYVLCIFPMVGFLIGLLWWIWSLVCSCLSVSPWLRGAGFCLLPVVVTGGIHLDGYADTNDALASHSSPAQRQKILKDPHCGSFAVIRLCSYFLGYAALCTVFSPTEKTIGCMVASFVFSRILSGFAVASFPIAKDTGLVHAFSAAAHRTQVRWILVVEAIGTAAVLCYLGRLTGIIMILSAVGMLWYYFYTAAKFGGISGDLAGWFLQKTEIWMLAALIFCQYGEGLL